MAKHNKKQKMEAKLAYQNDFEYLEDHFRLMDLFFQERQLEKSKKNSEHYEKKSFQLEEKIHKQQEKIEQRKKGSLEKHQSFSLDRLVKKYSLDSTEKSILLFLLYRYFSAESHATTGRMLLENII
jgi:flagellar motility protein MotE (MotC chaperone)